MNALPNASGYLQALQALPEISPADLLKGRHLVVVAPHPDDESLGMGGLVAAAGAQGTGVTVIFLTDGEASHVGSPSFPPERLADARRREALAALTALGIPADNAHFLSLGDSRLPFLRREQAERVMKHMREIVPGGPTLLCVTADTDPHGDHQAASRLVRQVSWPDMVEVMHFPVWTWRLAQRDLPDRAPSGFRIDVRAHLPEKRIAVAAHATQHGHVIHDAEEAFELDPAFVELFLGPTETLVWPT